VRDCRAGLDAVDCRADEAAIDGRDVRAPGAAGGPIDFRAAEFGRDVDDVVEPARTVEVRILPEADEAEDIVGLVGEGFRERSIVPLGRGTGVGLDAGLSLPEEASFELPGLDTELSVELDGRFFVAAPLTFGLGCCITTIAPGRTNSPQFGGQSK
jgi:hypothetical protein